MCVYSLRIVSPDKIMRCINSSSSSSSYSLSLIRQTGIRGHEAPHHLLLLLLLTATINIIIVEVRLALI